MLGVHSKPSPAVWLEVLQLAEGAVAGLDRDRTRPPMG